MVEANTDLVCGEVRRQFKRRENIIEIIKDKDERVLPVARIHRRTV